jgi:CPA1 family monovalent cation:H+ antiporter
MFDSDVEEASKQKIKKGLKLHVSRYLKNKYESNPDHPHVEKLYLQWEEKVKATEETPIDEKTKVIFIEVLEAQRQFLSNLNKDPDVDEELIRQQLYQIDLEEERLKVI